MKTGINKILMKAARQLRYRPLPEMIGVTALVESAATVPATIAAAVQPLFPFPLRFVSPQEPWITIALAKYRHLDVAFAVDGLEWLPDDNGGTAILREFGFASHIDEVPEDQREFMLQDEDPTCLNILSEDLDRKEPLLRLFWEQEPRRDVLDHVKEFMKAAKGHLMFGGVQELEESLEGFFPHRMVITDACLTNAGSIWFHRHFYL